MPLTKDFKVDIQEMRKLFKTVKHQFDLYFAGGRTDPPTADANELDRMVRWYRNQGLPTVAQQFLFSSFQNTHTVHAEKWNKWLRSREEGIAVDPRLPGSVQRARKELMELEKAPRTTSEEDKAPAATVKKAEKKQVAKASTARESAHERKLYDDFMSAHLKAGSIPNFDYSGFKKHLKKQEKAIRAKYDCKDISFAITSKDGKVKIKARVKKK